MDDGQRLVIALEARINQYERNLRKAHSTTNRQFGAMEKRAKQSARRMEASFAGAFKGFGGKLFALIGTTAVLRDAQKLIDASTGITNALKVAGLEGENLSKVYDELFASAQKNASPLEALVTLYGRASQSAADLGASQADLLKFTDNVALALRISGQSATESAGALLQLSQALGNGVVQAEEYNSLLDGGRVILQATAAGLKEAGGSVSALTRLVKSGKVSSEAFFRAFLAGAPMLQSKVAGAETTISQHMTRLQNALIDTAGKFDSTTEAGQFFGNAIDGVTAQVNAMNFDKLAGQLQAIINAYNAATNAALQFGASTGLENVGSWLTGGRPEYDPFRGTVFEGSLVLHSTKAEREVQDRINGAFGNGSGTSTGGLTPDAIRRSVNGGSVPEAATPTVITVNPSKPKHVSLADYPLPTTTSTGSGGSHSGGGGGGGSSANDFAREAEQIKERTAALDAMTAAQARVNPAIDDYGRAMTRAETEQELLTAAQRAGVEVTPELRAKIGQLADSYATAEAASAKLADSQDEARRRMDDMRGLGRDVLGGFIDDLRSGTSAADALANAVGKIEDKLIDVALNAVFSANGGGGFFGNLFGGLFGGFGGGQAAAALAGVGLFDRGGFTGRGGKHDPAGIVHRGEYVMSAEATRRLGVDNLERMHRTALKGYAAGGLVGGSAPRLPSGGGSSPTTINITTPVTVNAAGGSPEQNADLAKQVGKQVEGQMRAVVVDEILKLRRPGNILNNGFSR